MAVELIAVATLRARLSRVLDELRRKRNPIYVTQRGEARAVIVSIDEYNALLEQLEYLDDSLEALRMKELRESGRQKSRPWDAVKRERLGRGHVSR